MNSPITLTEFIHFVSVAEKEYQNAKLISVETEYLDGFHYTLYLNVNGKGIKYEIPTLEN